MNRRTRISTPRRLPTLATVALLLLTPVLAAERVPTALPRAEAWIPDSLAHWLEGIALLHGAEAVKAVDWFEAKQRENPNDPCVHYFVAMAYEEFGYGEGEDKPTWEELIDRGLEAADALDTDEPGARYCEGALYGLRGENRVQRGKYLGAAYDGKRFRRTMLDLKEEYPDFVDTLFWIGAYEYAADVLPGHIKFFKTLMFLPGGDRDKGLAMLEEVAEHGILDRFSAHFLLGAFYEQQERPDDRRRIVEKLDRRYPDFPWAGIMLAWSYAEAEPPDFERAFALHEEEMARVAAREAEDRAELLVGVQLSMARLYQAALDHRAAVEILEPIYADVRGDENEEIPAAFSLVRSLNRTGRHDEAMEVLRGIEERYPDYENLEVLRVETGLLDGPTGLVYEAALPARVLARDGKTKEAEAAFRALLQRYPDHPEIHFRMAEMYFDEKSYPRAEAYLLKAVDGDPSMPTYVVPYGWLQLGQICDATDRRREAKANYRRAIDAANGFTGLRNAAKGYLKEPYVPPED